MAGDIAACVAGEGFVALPITLVDAERAGQLRGEHRDPFNRMLIAQALARDLSLVSIERLFEDFGALRLRA